MIKKRISCILVFIALTGLINGQNLRAKKWDLKGNVRDLQNTWIQDFDETWYTWNTINNRIDFKWFPDSLFSVGFGIRNQVTYGQLIQFFTAFYPEFSKQYEMDPAFFDLTGIISRNSSYILSGNIDRAFLQYSKNKWDIRAGRQRVNWGIGLVWNPNDIFNTFSYFDFDYEERPGCDAIRIQYYGNYTSNFQLVSKMNSRKEITLAGMYKFNNWNYDFQVLGGIMENDVVLGGGWAGQVRGGGFRGEFSWFSEKNESLNSKGILVAVLEGDYTFKNSLYAHIATLYTSNGTTGKAAWGTYFINNDISAKSFTLARHSIFAQLSYPLTPLINGSISNIFNPCDKSVFFGPSTDISLSNNLGLLLMAQIFAGEHKTEFGGYGSIFYLRFKYSF